MKSAGFLLAAAATLSVGILMFCAGALAADGAPPALVINEVMASNVSCLADPQGQFDDWIEIHNAGNSPVDLAGMWLTDDITEPTKWRFPSGSATMVVPGGFLIVWADEDIGDSGLHAGFQLSASGEEVCLFAPDGLTLIGSLSFGPQDPDISFGRYPDAGEVLQFFHTPTPGRANEGGFPGEVAPLRFSHERGFCDSAFELTITTDTQDAQILYTTEGIVPNSTDHRFMPGKTYTGPIPIGTTTCVRAVAIRQDWKPTQVYTHTYVFDTRSSIRSLPMISLVGDPGKTFYEPDGVMAIVGGTYSSGVWTSTGPDSYNNPMNRDIERPVSAEWILPSSGEGFQIDCGLRVHGSDYMRPRYVRQNGTWSGNGKFSLRLYFRGEYGRSQLEYPLFPLSAVDEFDTVVLRAGHNDRVNPFIKDELLRRLHRDMGQVACMGTFANLFINGMYKGYFNLTEHVKEESCQRWFNSDKPWDVMTMFNDIRDGDSRSWDAMISYARNHNLAVPAYYAQMCTMLDVECFIDYLIVRLWPNDWDWPQNNWSAACERSETGRWKFFVWDAEGTFESGQLQLDRFGELNSQNNGNGYLYRALKASPEFRQLFADRLYKHFYNGGAMSATNIQKRFFEMRDELKGVIPSMNTYIINTWVPSRLGVFFSACLREGMYTFDGPGFLVNNIRQHGGHMSADGLLGIVPVRAGTTMYYTIDGSDPAGLFLPQTLEVATLVARDASKHVLVPTGQVADDWRSPDGFNDVRWMPVSGAPGGVGYERSTAYDTHISLDVERLMYNINGSCLIRIPFQFGGDIQALETMTLHVQYDDGFVAYLNSAEVARRNAPATPTWNSVATAGNSDSAAVLFESIDISSHRDKLRAGSNMLAIHALNSPATSSDFLINAELSVSRTITQDDPAESLVYTGPIPLARSTVVKARARDGNTWSALAEAVFAVGPVKENLRISEIMYHPTDPNAEFIELTNIGAQTIDLNLVRLADGIDFVFGPVRLDPGGCCLVVEDVNAFEAVYGRDLPCVGQYTGKLSNAGDRIELRDAVDTVIHAFEYGDRWHDATDGEGYSLTIRDLVVTNPNAWGDASKWRPSAQVGGSPGYDDSDDVTLVDGVVINELLADASGQVGDWIELHNVTSRPVSIGGWYLSDDPDDPTRYEIAAGTTIDALDYLVLTEEDNFGNPADPGSHTPITLGPDSGTLYLHSVVQGTFTGYRGRVEFGPSEPNIPFGRHVLSTGQADFVALRDPTPGGSNAYPVVGPIVISEIMYHPDNPADAEYVELLNISDANVTLYDASEGLPWRLADDTISPGVELIFRQDPPVTLAPGRYLLLVKDLLLCQGRYTIPATASILEWGPGRLGNAGETVMLFRPGRVDEKGDWQWVCVDRVAFSDGAHPQAFPTGVDPWPIQADGLGLSLTRLFTTRHGNDPNNWQAADPSPGYTKRRIGR